MTVSGSYGTTIFCDDIRDEILGKKTFIGCYTDRLIAPQLPILLPTFAMYVRFLEPFEEAEDILHINVTLEHDDGEVTTVLDAEIPNDRREQVSDEHRDAEADRLASVMYLRSSPFVIDKPGTLRVRALRGDEEFKLGKLRIVVGELPGDSLTNQATVFGRLDSA